MCMYVCVFVKGVGTMVHDASFRRACMMHAYIPTHMMPTYIPTHMMPTHIPTLMISAYIPTHMMPTYIPTLMISAYIPTHMMPTHIPTLMMPAYIPTHMMPTYIPTYPHTYIHSIVECDSITMYMCRVSVEYIYASTYTSVTYITYDNLTLHTYTPHT